MSKQTEIRFNLDGLDDIKKAIGDKYVTRVGIINDKAGQIDGDSGLSNAQLGFIQMFGSITNNIPPRDFLSMPLQHESKDLIKALSANDVKAAFAARNYKKVMALLGVAAEEIIQRAFETGGFGQWSPNAEITINGGWMKNKKSGKPFFVKGKKSEQPLIDKGELRDAITSDVVSKGSAK